MKIEEIYALIEDDMLEEFTRAYDPIKKLIVAHGGLFNFSRALRARECSVRSIPGAESDRE